jgi:hypothetical protein
MKFKTLCGIVAKNFKQHIIDTTAFNVAAAPIYATLENVVVGMPDDVCLKMRLFGAGLGYAGLAFLYARGRDAYRNYFRISPNSSEFKQGTHDFLYYAAFSVLLSPAMYALTGATLKENIAGTALSALIALPVGWLGGYCIDAGRDLTGIQESQRVPGIIRNLSGAAKKTIAAVSILASAGLVYSILAATPDTPKPPVRVQAPAESVQKE